METKACKICGDIKELSFFPREMRKGAWYYLPSCKICTERKKSRGKKAYRENNKVKLSNGKRIWYQNNKKNVKTRVSAYKKQNRQQYNENRKKRIKNDPAFRLRENVRSLIKSALKKNASPKNGASISMFLSYSMVELEIHLESRFEFWMTWDNQGKYNSKTWNDNDPSTWTWQLDHIMPQADLLYVSMADDNFKKCWSLKNLRPLSAKQNSIDGASRIRHTRNK